MKPNHISLPSHANPIVLEWIENNLISFQKGPLESKCWIWKGRVNGVGYAGVTDPTTKENAYAHRLAINARKGMLALHSCDTPKCVNPSHLREGTDADNEADKKARNRVHRGKSKRCFQCKINAKQSSTGLCRSCKAINDNDFCICGQLATAYKGKCSKCYSFEYRLKIKAKKILKSDSNDAGFLGGI